VALTTDGQVVDTSYTSGRTHSGHLLGMIGDVLRLAATPLKEVDAFAVTRGPGTFTGLRIGISAAKGMALACGKPLVGISGLEALAVQSALPSRLLCPMVDARRSEVYFACFRQIEGQVRRVTEEKALPPAEAIAAIGEACLFVGNGAELYRELIETSMGDLGAVAPPVQAIIRASTVARLAAERLREGDLGDAGRLAPLYIRRSDAQLKLGRKQETGLMTSG
jgi:tRNA threonylcarbamoyladenosine biosynthesis protein TsaB